MAVTGILILVLWLVLLLYWYVFAPKSKRSSRGYNWQRVIVVRLILIVIVILLLRIASIKSYILSVDLAPHFNPIIAASGVLICAFGVGLAIWARSILARNWGMPMTLREKPELITTGPYAFIRHPIYSGFFLATLGTVLVSGLFWLFILVILSIYFVFSSKVEEADMMNQFPKEYPEYKKRAKAFIPFIF
jgi:hypothetical protein